MRLLTSLLLVAGVACGQFFEVSGEAPGWRKVLAAHGLLEGGKALPQVIVIADEGRWKPEQARARAADGAVLVVSGLGKLAREFGITPGTEDVLVRHLRDASAPDLPVLWEKEEKLRVPVMEGAWQVTAWERWKRVPMVAWLPVGKGGVLWTATGVGAQGYERYPFLPQALLKAGVAGKARSRELWAFFDASYRQRVDPEYLVERWKKAGLAGVHVASWQFDSTEEAKAAWLGRLISLCHVRGIHVYAWVELPHVSERFWRENPECRERTAAGTEAELDWRQLINLVNPACAAKAERSVLGLLRSFEWDGVNLGELYFESLEGAANLARFTPLNADVDAEFRAKYGVAPMADVPHFLEYRVELAARLQSAWLEKLEGLRKERPDFDIVLTHIDDRLDKRMREALGADSARLLAATEGKDLVFLVEDPATVWHLGPARYAAIAEEYAGLTKTPGRLAVDLNIVERYQDVYPTKQQTGAELAQLVHEAAKAFDRVALYFEYSLAPRDQALPGMAAGGLEAWEERDGKVRVKLARQAAVKWAGDAKVNGQVWPLSDGRELLLPAGEWVLEKSDVGPEWRLADLNARVLGVETEAGKLVIRYQARAGSVVEAVRGGERVVVRVKRGEGRLELPLGVGSN